MDQKASLNDSLFIFAGELSADLHGENIIRALKQKRPTLHIWGVGGPRMRSTGMECILPMEAFQVMGFIDVLLTLPKLVKHFFFLRKAILARKPTAALFIDYADFNMRLEASLRKKGFQGKMIHYISPSVWAWRKGRIQTMANNLDLLLSIYPFESAHFAKTPLKVVYVGHPLIQRLQEHAYQNDLFPQDKPILALFPGSRAHEIERNLPVMLRVLKQTPNISSFAVILSLSHPRFKSLIDTIIQKEHTSLSVQCIPSESNYELMKAAHTALAKSGTVTLELALHEVPTIVVYEIALLDKWIGKYLLRILLPYYCIVNIIMKRMVFPEFFEHHIDVKAVNKALQSFLTDPLQRNQCIQDCRELKALLSQKNTNEEAASAILPLL